MPECPLQPPGEKQYCGGDTWSLTFFCYQTLYGQRESRPSTFSLNVPNSREESHGLSAAEHPAQAARATEAGERGRGGRWKRDGWMVTRQQRKKAEWPVSQELLRTHLLFITILPGSDTDCFPTRHKAALAGLHQQQSLPELKRRPREPRRISHRLAWELESSQASAAKGRPKRETKTISALSIKVPVTRQAQFRQISLWGWREPVSLLGFPIEHR